MKIPVDIYERNKKFTVIDQQKNASNLEFVDHLWLPFLDQPQSDIVFFARIPLYIYKILLSKFKHGIGTIDIITFNEELEFLSTLII